MCWFFLKNLIKYLHIWPFIFLQLVQNMRTVKLTINRCRSCSESTVLWQYLDQLGGFKTTKRISCLFSAAQRLSGLPKKRLLTALSSDFHQKRWLCPLTSKRSFIGSAEWHSRRLRWAIACRSIPLANRCSEIWLSVISMHYNFLAGHEWVVW